MEEARQYTFVDRPWFARVLAASVLATLVLLPVSLMSLFFGNVFPYVFAIFCATAFLRIALPLTWSWQKREFKEWGSRICSRETSPIGYWLMMGFGVIAAGLALLGLFVSLSLL